jgi:PBSX family phage terminase large subunit
LSRRRKLPKKELIILTDKQEKARRMMMEKNHYISILFDGGSRAGKSWIIVIVIILLCYKYQGLRVLIARLRFAHARASLWEQTLIPILTKMHINYKTDKSLWIVKIGKSEIWLGGLDDKQRTEKVLGQEYSLIFLNEAAEIPQSSRDIVLTRLAQNIKDFNNFIIYDCNPRQPTHYLYKEFYKEKNKNRAKLKFLPKDNREHLPKGYIENILSNLPKDKRKRFLEGKWSYLPGAVYHNVFEKNKINCEKNIYKFYDDITVGIDWGLHTACTIWGVKLIPKKIQMYCIHEIVIINGTTDDLIGVLDKVFGIKQANHILYCDHEPDRILKLQNAGYAAKKAYKEVGPGDDSVNVCELFFDKNCEYTFQSMINLVNQSNPSGQGFLYGKHVKENDHESDSGRYAIHGWIMDNKISLGGHYLLRKVI